MNNQSPLVPQGSMIEQKNKGRARVKIAVFVVLAIHGVGLLALLMQGCKKQSDSASLPEATNNVASNLTEPTNAQPAFVNETPLQPSNHLAAPDIQAPVAPTSAATDYKIAKGDTLITVARKFHVSLKAVTDANPGVDPAKLQIGQTLHIPAAAIAAPTTLSTGSALASADPAGGQPSWVVKSGDSLSKIATQFGTSVKALRAANDLKTDRIVVGQKLRIPAKASAANTPSTLPGDSATTTTAAASTPLTTTAQK